MANRAAENNAPSPISDRADSSSMHDVPHSDTLRTNRPPALDQSHFTKQNSSRMRVASTKYSPY